MSTMQRFSVILGLAVACGCGGGVNDAPKLAPVAGIVKYKNRPVPEASVTFHPEKGPLGTAKTDAEGKFQIKTNGSLGAVVGKHKVTLSNAIAPEAMPEANGKEIEYAKKVQGVVPAKYNNVETTDLQVEIPEAGNEQLTLDAT